MPEPRFKDQCILVTGGASGIGRAVAALLISQGARVAVWDRDADGLAAVQETLNVWGCCLDVSDHDEVSAALEATLHTFGRLNGVVHCAGLSLGGEFLTREADAQRQVILVNVWGAVNVVRAVLPAIQAAQGMIMLVSSVAGYYGTPDFAVYGATKAAILNFVQALQIELAGTGTVIGVVSPHFTHTPMMTESCRSRLLYLQSPFIEVTTPEQVAHTIVEGLFYRRSYAWTGWRPYVLYTASRYFASIYRVLITHLWQHQTPPT